MRTAGLGAGATFIMARTTTTMREMISILKALRAEASLSWSAEPVSHVLRAQNKSSRRRRTDEQYRDRATDSPVSSRSWRENPTLLPRGIFG